MKKAVFLIALTLLFRPVFPVAEYIVNYEYITKTLCINKAKPQMHCNGKCHLMKELAKAAETEKPLSPDKKGNAKSTAEELFFEPLKPLLNDQVLTLYSQTVSSHYSNLYDHETIHSVFRPPIFTA